MPPAGRRVERRLGITEAAAACNRQEGGDDGADLKQFSWWFFFLWFFGGFGWFDFFVWFFGGFTSASVFWFDFFVWFWLVWFLLVWCLEFGVFCLVHFGLVGFCVFLGAGLGSLVFFEVLVGFYWMVWRGILVVFLGGLVDALVDGLVLWSF